MKVQEYEKIHLKTNIQILAESKEELQLKIDKLSEYCSKWELIIGLPKTKVMKFGGGYIAAKVNHFYFRGSNVEVVKFYTYLGVTFKHNLLFDKHIQLVKDATTKAEYGLISKLTDFKIMMFSLHSNFLTH